MDETWKPPEKKLRVDHRAWDQYEREAHEQAPKPAPPASKAKTLQARVKQEIDEIVRWKSHLAREIGSTYTVEEINEGGIRIRIPPSSEWTFVVQENIIGELWYKDDTGSMDMGNCLFMLQQIAEALRAETPSTHDGAAEEEVHCRVHADSKGSGAPVLDESDLLTADLAEGHVGVVVQDGAAENQEEGGTSEGCHPF